MKRRSIRGLAATLWLAIAVVVAPFSASALLVGDSVTVTLEDLTVSGGGTIFPTALVTNPRTVGAGNEFNNIPYTNAFPSPNETSSWSLDITDTGFTLTGTCTTPFSVGCEFDGLQLTLSDLDFTPPGTVLTAIVPGAATLPLDSSSVTPGPPSSVVVTFADFALGTNSQPSTKSFSAEFTVRTPTAVPGPGSLLLVLVGGLALGAYVIRRTLS